MNRPPEILINNGFVTDANGVLTEMVIPNNVVTQNMPSVITMYATTLNWIPSNASTLVELICYSTNLPTNILRSYTRLTTASFPMLQTLSAASTGTADSGHFWGCTGLTSLNFPALTTIGNVRDGASVNSSGHFRNCTGLTSLNLPALTTIGTALGTYSGHFYGCTGLTSLNLPALTTIGDTGLGRDGGHFCGCTGLTSLNLPALTTIGAAGTSLSGVYNCGQFWNCTGLVTVNLPHISSIGIGTSGSHGAFGKCTSLQNVTLGSPGHAVTNIVNAFYDCTQAGLTITIYTTGGAALSGEPWGATNATIEYEEA